MGTGDEARSVPQRPRSTRACCEQRLRPPRAWTRGPTPRRCTRCGGGGDEGRRDYKEEVQADGGEDEHAREAARLNQRSQVSSWESIASSGSSQAAGEDGDEGREGDVCGGAVAVEAAVRGFVLVRWTRDLIIEGRCERNRPTKSSGAVTRRRGAGSSEMEHAAAATGRTGACARAMCDTPGIHDGEVRAIVSRRSQAATDARSNSAATYLILEVDTDAAPAPHAFSHSFFEGTMSYLASN
ncbi:hypothetical protein B0H17DRAFT_1179919 [Mycena rosella]|uniref:Uncharacterized protein n=1 Tax=Mycena rosella TaxID=1033263 RepID=A0AAD7DFD0_MYCRO|nr:hypothetical protein B0H17DRAFT_1179919 [Mycena rosella]